ncbi:hypothetical protein MP228_003319 [Amoeboaphelidium protococcarum]|nr:hypothetical protein MP228_003319 [Amoeboaphelidium protococcarum]
MMPTIIYGTRPGDEYWGDLGTSIGQQEYLRALNDNIYSDRDNNDRVRIAQKRLQIFRRQMEPDAGDIESAFHFGVPSNLRNQDIRQLMGPPPAQDQSASKVMVDASTQIDADLVGQIENEEEAEQDRAVLPAANAGDDFQVEMTLPQQEDSDEMYVNSMVNGIFDRAIKFDKSKQAVKIYYQPYFLNIKPLLFTIKYYTQQDVLRISWNVAKIKRAANSLRYKACRMYRKLRCQHVPSIMNKISVTIAIENQPDINLYRTQDLLKGYYDIEDYAYIRGLDKHLTGTVKAAYHHGKSLFSNDEQGDWKASSLAGKTEIISQRKFAVSAQKLHYGNY